MNTLLKARNLQTIVLAWAGLLLGWYEKYGSPINLKIGSFSRVHVSKARDVEVNFAIKNTLKQV